jgi:hypothetical protein
MKKEEILKILELSFVWVVCLAMFIYGIGKYLQFDNPELIPKTVAEMTGMELMWSFYGYSKGYAILLGIAEITGGILFLIYRTRVLGGLLLTVILSNVIIQDIIYEVNRGALIAAIIYQAMIIAVLWMNQQALKAGIKAMLLDKKPASAAPLKKWLLLLMALAFAFIWKWIEYRLTH